MDDLGERIRALPGADRLLPALEGLAPAWLVGGAVRDKLLGRDTDDVDLAIPGDPKRHAQRIAMCLRVIERTAFKVAETHWYLPSETDWSGLD